MNITRRRIFITIILIACLFTLWTDDALVAERGDYRKRPAKVARSDQMSVTPSRSNDAIVYRQLAKTVDLSDLQLYTPFSQAIEILRNSTSLPLNIAVLWRDLSENALVERDTQIYMEGLSGISLRAGLELLLRAVSSGPAELGYVVEGGVIIIATKNSLPVKMVTRVYDISDLVAEPANYRFGMPVGGFGGGWGAYGRPAGGYTGGLAMRYGPRLRSQRASQISDLITGSIAPGTWR